MKWCVCVRVCVCVFCQRTEVVSYVLDICGAEWSKVE